MAKEITVAVVLILPLSPVQVVLKPEELVIHIN